MDDSPLYGLILFIVFIVISGIMYAFGEAIRQINTSDLEKRVEDGDKAAGKLLKLVEKPEKFIVTVHMVSAVTVAIVGYFQLKVYGQRLYDYFAYDKGLSSIFVEELLYIVAYILVAIYLLILVISLGILVPKKLGSRYPEIITKLLRKIVAIIMGIFTPFTAIISFFGNAVLRLFGIDPSEEALNVTEEEIISIVNEGHEQGVLEEREAEMISNIMELDNKTVDDIMVHRKNIVAVDGTWTLKETLEFIIDKHFSRFPVYIDDIDNIIGILHIRNALEAFYDNKDCDKQIKDIDELLMEAKFIPESRDIDDLLKDMQVTKIHMDIVVDEYGQTSGIIAMEDIIEEIVGNIMDEYDVEEHNIIKESDNIYLVKGLTTLEEMEETIGDTFKDENYDTLNGFIISKLERIPGDDERPEIVIDNYKYKVLNVENRRISQVRMERLPKEEETIEE